MSRLNSQSRSPRTAVILALALAAALLPSGCAETGKYPSWVNPMSASGPGIRFGEPMGEWVASVNPDDKYYYNVYDPRWRNVIRWPDRIWFQSPDEIRRQLPEKKPAPGSL